MASASAAGRATSGLGRQPVDHDEQLVGAREVEPGGQLVEVMRRPVGQHPDEAQRPEVLDDRVVGEPGDGGSGKQT